ncbi:VOC family protein [Variovorax sp. HJSM1_2]|uniref:VOC family protein n=1 Tax=Variovorax sp. HJSM1_2 TaxID=3366263 RepID=UPI003BC0BD89
MPPHQDLKTLRELLGPDLQISFVVKDLDAALDLWTLQMGVGPFVVFEKSLGDRRFLHHGKVSDVQMSVALSYRGETQIEIITQVNDAPSIYSEFFASGREGLQHIAFAAADYEQACRRFQAIGFKEVSAIHMPDGTKNVSYFQSPESVGVVVELVPMTPARRTYYDRIKALAASWDGMDPVRRYRDSVEFLAKVCS